MSNAKNWCFTINNFNADVLERFEDLTTLLGSELSYFVVGKEIGENGTPHIQGNLFYLKLKVIFSSPKEYVLPKYSLPSGKLIVK